MTYAADIGSPVAALLQRAVAADMEEKAEAIIQKALKEYEAQIRKVLARAVLATLEQNYSVERMGSDLHITVRHVYGGN